MGRLIVMNVLLAMMGCGKLIMTLELKDVQNFAVEIAEAGGKKTLKITGLSKHSGMSVWKDRLERVGGGEVVVKVILAPPRSGGSGSFSVVVPVDNDIERVSFGDERKEIWHR